MKKKNMESTRKDLVREYKQRPKTAGVFVIRNKANGKILLGSSLNLEGALNRHRFSLNTGSHRNKALQQDWKTYGEDNFELEIVATVEPSADPDFRAADELNLLEQIWIEKLNPFGEMGYNAGRSVRQA